MQKKILTSKKGQVIKLRTPMMTKNHLKSENQTHSQSRIFAESAVENLLTTLPCPDPTTHTVMDISLSLQRNLVHHI